MCVGLQEFWVLFSTDRLSARNKDEETVYCVSEQMANMFNHPSEATWACESTHHCVHSRAQNIIGAHVSLELRGKHRGGGCGAARLATHPFFERRTVYRRA